MGSSTNWPTLQAALSSQRRAQCQRPVGMAVCRPASGPPALLKSKAWGKPLSSSPKSKCEKRSGGPDRLPTGLNMTCRQNWEKFVANFVVVWCYEFIRLRRRIVSTRLTGVKLMLILVLLGSKLKTLDKAPFPARPAHSLAVGRAACPAKVHSMRL